MLFTLGRLGRWMAGFSRAACGVALVLAAWAAPALAVPPAPPPVPEIDPGSLASALALVTGGVMLLRGRVRR